MRVFGLIQRALLLACFLQPAWCCAAPEPEPEPGEAWDEPAEVAEPEVEEAGYLQDAIPFEDPAQEALVQELVDQAVAARLAGIPHPRYIPATDLVPPKGLLFLKTDPRRGEFPFGMARGGYMQLRWF